MRTRILLIVLAAVCLAVLFTTKVANRMPDFEVYWTAGSRALAAQPLYRVEDGHFVFKYLPAFAVLFAPIALMPLAVAKALWFTMSAILMLVLLGVSASAMPNSRRSSALLIVLTFVAMAKFYAHELQLGQVNLLFAVVVVAAVVLLRRRQDAVAGILLGLAVVVKPYALLFVPWLASRRSKRPFATMVATVTLALVLPAVRYGWRGNVRLLSDWWRTVTESSPPNLMNHDNVSLASVFTRWLGPGTEASIAAILVSLALVGLAAIVIAGRGQLEDTDPLEVSLALVLIPLLSPQGWDYVFLICTPGVMLLINDFELLPRALRLATGVAIFVVAFTIYDVVGRTAYLTFMTLAGITICFIVEYVALVSLRFRRVA